MWALEFCVVVGRRVEVLVQAIQGPERVMAEIAFIAMAIERAFVGEISDESGRGIDRALNSASD